MLLNRKPFDTGSQILVSTILLEVRESFSRSAERRGKKRIKSRKRRKEREKEGGGEGRGRN